MNPLKIQVITEYLLVVSRPEIRKYITLQRISDTIELMETFAEQFPMICHQITYLYKPRCIPAFAEYHHWITVFSSGLVLIGRVK